MGFTLTQNLEFWNYSKGREPILSYLFYQIRSSKLPKSMPNFYSSIKINLVFCNYLYLKSRQTNSLHGLKLIQTQQQCCNCCNSSCISFKFQSSYFFKQPLLRPKFWTTTEPGTQCGIFNCTAKPLLLYGT